MSARVVAVTGATGLVGPWVCAALAGEGLSVRAIVRRAGAAARIGAVSDEVAVGDMDGATRWDRAFSGAQAVVHLADPVGAAGLAALLDGVRRTGVRRVVLVSSVKAIGEATPSSSARFDDATPPAPRTAYGRRKLAAERALAAACRGAFEPVVLRPPLVHGPGARGGLGWLVRAVRAGAPLPLLSVRNARSLVGVENLADAVRAASLRPEAAGGAWLVADGPPVSTPDLVRQIGRAVGRPARLFPAPVALLEAAGRLPGLAGPLGRLVGNLAVDDAAFRRAVGWAPPRTLEQGLARLGGPP